MSTINRTYSEQFSFSLWGLLLKACVKVENPLGKVVQSSNLSILPLEKVPAGQLRQVWVFTSRNSPLLHSKSTKEKFFQELPWWPTCTLYYTQTLFSNENDIFLIPLACCTQVNLAFGSNIRWSLTALDRARLY